MKLVRVCLKYLISNQCFVVVCAQLLYHMLHRNFQTSNALTKMVLFFLKSLYSHHMLFFFSSSSNVIFHSYDLLCRLESTLVKFYLEHHATKQAHKSLSRRSCTLPFLISFI